MAYKMLWQAKEKDQQRNRASMKVFRVEQMTDLMCNWTTDLRDASMAAS